MRIVYDAHSVIGCIGRPGHIVDSANLKALSPLDGRYCSKAAPLRNYLSEYALIRYRTLVEVNWLQHLADEPSFEDLKTPGKEIKHELRTLVDDFSLEDAMRVKTIEAKTNHDVKAVEYFLAEKFGPPLSAFFHFGCTSEDINNLAYALMLHDTRQQVLIPLMKTLTTELQGLAHRFADIPMLARTHGQPASPTTLGKEIANFVPRLKRQIKLFAEITIYGKCNGAVGNFNAHMAAYPSVDWQNVSARFVASLGLKPNVYTTQIEPHDWLAEYSQTLTRFNNVLIDLTRDLWGYVSLGYFRSIGSDAEVGSSTMPHKINPIEFENAEGNLGMANAVLAFLASKLTKSRWQRDLSDSTVLRNLAVGLGHSLIAYESCQRGLGKLEADVERLNADLVDSWEILAEAVQTVMRSRGITDAYEQLRKLTRGQSIQRETLHNFIRSSDLPEEDKNRLLELKPKDYLGIATELAKNV